MYVYDTWVVIWIPQGQHLLNAAEILPGLAVSPPLGVSDIGYQDAGRRGTNRGAVLAGLPKISKSEP